MGSGSKPSQNGRLALGLWGRLCVCVAQGASLLPAVHHALLRYHHHTALLQGGAVLRMARAYLAYGLSIRPALDAYTQALKRRRCDLTSCC
jgi:hypothetical protein